MDKDITKKNIFWNTLGSFTLAVTSLIYTMIMTRFCDLNDVGVFSFAFSFACMMVTLASFGGRTYQVTDTSNEINTFTYIATRYLTVGLSFILVFIFIIFRNYNSLKNIVIILLCLFKFLEEISDVYYGILQKKNQLYKVGQYQFIKSLLNIILFFVGIKIFNNYFISIIFITINNFLVLLFERKKTRNILKYNIKINKEEILKLLKINFYICGYTFLSSYLVNAPKYAIDQHLTSDVQAIFNMLIMPATIMLLIGGFIINPIIVNIAQFYEKNNYRKIKDIVKKIIVILFTLGIFILFGTYLFGDKILHIIYGIDFSNYRLHLCIVIIGAILYTFTTILGTILIALRKINIQFYISIICSLLAFFISNFLVLKFKMLGGFYSYLFIMIIRTIIYIVLFIIIIKKKINLNGGKNDYNINANL